MALSVDVKVLENVKTSAEWAADNPILPNRVKGYDSTVKHYKIGDGIKSWSELPFWEFSQPAPISFIVLAGDPDTYNLTTDEVAAINQLGRYPNTVFVIGGQEFKDIYPVYTGNPGTFSNIAVHFHSDGNGNNLDTTYVQFS